MTGVEILQAWYERVWEQGDLDAVAEYFDVDAMANGLMTDLAAELEDFQTIVPAVLRLIRNVKITITHSMEDGDKAWALVDIKAQNAENMSPVVCSGQVMIKTKNNKIIEAYNHFDFMSFFEQLGFLPKDTIALCLSGEQLS
ncbi:ester cyclase [Pacificibacter marinus]|uniref:ester cyclase n=1 Tax=Pacificibacter marinus TaxID=658057 RepID=UPI001C06A887|nr:ester cyclase [Pacificibacter marinus]MBU2866362.1 ester cyclase [Pacificibacter marinus]